MGLILAASLALLLGSCGTSEPVNAVLWTDRPEFAIYAEYFNSGQKQYKVEVQYLASPAEALTTAVDFPDIVAGSWLKSSSTRTLFRPLDDLFDDGSLGTEDFYPRLLALGQIDNKQYLLPVSFNLPALVFSRNTSSKLSNFFTVSLEEIKNLGKAHNKENNGVYSQMGFCFSPAWNDEFLFITATLFNASFKEADPLAWDTPALEKAIGYIQNWIDDANSGILAEDDFAFKYFYEPRSKLLMSGRLLFISMKSSEFFTMPAEQREGLDFRWIAGDDRIPLSEEAVYYGISKDGKARKAADAFTRWFFREDTQRFFLEIEKKYRLDTTIFGIGNGFSAMRTVTEQIFPQYYPGLLGHMPPEAFLEPPNILPRNWPDLKERVILPYLHERIRSTGAESRSLEQQIADWARLNRN